MTIYKLIEQCKNDGLHIPIIYFITDKKYITNNACKFLYKQIKSFNNFINSQTLKHIDKCYEEQWVVYELPFDFVYVTDRFINILISMKCDINKIKYLEGTTLYLIAVNNKVINIYNFQLNFENYNNIALYAQVDKA